MVELDGIVDSYVHLYHQKPQAWTFELDLRTFKEKWYIGYNKFYF